MKSALRIAFIALLLTTGSPALPQASPQGPGFPCAKAATSVEKMICSDRTLSALDFQYNQLYTQRLRDRGNEEAAQIRNTARDSLAWRDSCVNESLGDRLPRSASVECLEDYYYARIAALSEMPVRPPAEWSRALVAGARVYTTLGLGLRSTWPKKVRPEVYFRPTVGGPLSRLKAEPPSPPPARMDRSFYYQVSRNVFGSLTYVQEFQNDGQVSVEYFFNRNGRLAAVRHWTRAKLDAGNYFQEETLFYGTSGLEIERRFATSESGNGSRGIALKRADLSLPSLQKPAFSSFGVFLSTTLGGAVDLDIDRLGLCEIAIINGGGPRILNFAAEPLDVYAQAIPKMDDANLDSVDLKGERGVLAEIGTLAGKHVYSVKYPNTAVLAVLVEREAGRYLPVLLAAPQADILHLEVLRADGQDVLYYSAAVPGTGMLTEDWLFTISNGIPREAGYNDLLSKEIARILPRDHSVGRAPRFDPARMTFGAITRSASGSGSIEVVFGVRNGRLFVKSSQFGRNEN